MAGFEKINIRTGTITEVSDFIKARNPTCQLKIDFGEPGTKKSAARGSCSLQKEDLIGKQVIAVVNFTPEQIPNFFSECLVPGVYTGEKQVILLQPQQVVTNEMKIG